MKKYTYILLSLAVMLPALLDAQELKIYHELDEVTTGNKTFVATDYISFLPGFHFKATENESFHAYIDDSGNATPELIYKEYVAPSNRTLNKSLPVGTLPGSVSINSGVAHYQIPLEVPPGINGLQPNLSISYSSTSGAGLLGEKWNLSGIQAITREQPSQLFDELGVGLLYTTDDAFSLNGERLIKTNSNVLRTYIETHQSIRGIPNLSQNPLSFELKTKEGMTLMFGATADSKQHVNSTPNSPVQAWYLNEAIDPFGNSMTYEYGMVANQLVLKKIEYTGGNNNTPFASVTFLYAEKSNPKKYLFGVKNYQGKINDNLVLKTIKISHQNKQIKRYEFEYIKKSDSWNVRTLLHEIKVKGTNGVGYNSTLIDWQDQSIERETKSFVNTQGNNLILNQTGLLCLDFNGDGYSDVLEAEHTYDGNKYNLYENKKDGSFDYFYTTTNDFGANGYGYGFTYKNLAAYLTDINKDLNQDLIHWRIKQLSVQEGYTHKLEINVGFYLKNGNTYSFGNDGSYGMDMYTNNINTRVVSGDFNGDRKVDLLGLTVEETLLQWGCKGTPEDQTWAYLKFNGLNENYYAIDFNSNGKTDVVEITEDGLYVWEWDENANRFGQYYFNPSIKIWHNIQFSDWNGDGLTDIKGFYATPVNEDNTESGDPYEIHEYCYASTGKVYANYWTAPIKYTTRQGWEDWIEYYQYFFVDLNGDGLSEQIRVGLNGQVIIWPQIGYCMDVEDVSNSYANNFEGYSVNDCGNIEFYLDRGATLDFEYVKFADFNGDGKIDLYYGDPITPKVYGFTDANQGFGMVSGIVDGMNNSTTFDYATSVKDICYESDPSNIYTAPLPIANKLPFPVVKKVTTHVENVLTKSVDYTYHQAYIDLKKLGFIGFREIKETNDKATKATQNTYDFPTGQVLKTNYSVTNHNGIDGSPLEVGNGFTQFQQTLLPIDNDKNITRKRIHVSHTYEKDLLTGITTTNDYQVDEFGNVNEHTFWRRNPESFYITNTTVDHFISPNNNTPYLPNVVTTTSYIDGTDGFVTKVDHDYSLTGLLINKKELHPVSEVEVTNNTYEYYPNTANLKKVTTTAAGLPSAIVNYEEYDPTGRFATRITNALGHSKTFSYDGAFGVITSSTSPTNLTKEYRYDGFGKLTKTILPTGVEITQNNQWEDNGPVGTLFSNIKTATGSPSVTTFANAAGQTLQEKSTGYNGAVYLKDMAYNTDGQVASSTNVYEQSGVNKKTYSFEYDAFGRIYDQYAPDQPDAITTRYTFGSGEKTMNNPNVPTPITSKVIYDAGGNMSKVFENDLEKIAYTYHSSGQPKKIEANEASTFMEYDDLGRQKKLDDPNMNPVNYTYNAYGQLENQIDGEGNSYTMTYDGLGRILTKTNDNNASDVTTYTYVASGNGLGQLEKVSKGNGTEMSYVYDDFNRLASQTEKADATHSYTSSYTYYTDGKLKTHTYPNGYVVTNMYDLIGTLIEIKGGETNDNQSTIWTLGAINNHGQISNYAYGNGLNIEEKYDNFGMPEQFHTLGSNVFNMSYSFDHITGNLNSRTHVVNGVSQTESFTYDGYDRLETITRSGNAVLDMDYLDNGNIHQKSDVGVYRYNDLPHALSSIDSTELDWLSLAEQNITYTPFDKTETVSEGDHRLTFLYGATNDRVRATYETKDAGSSWQSHKTVYYAAEYEETYHADGTVQKRIYINTPSGLAAIYTENENGNGALHYIHQDYQGSIVAISDESGNPEQSLSYDAWGQRRNPTNWGSYDLTEEPLFERGYTGHEHLETFGLINMNGRVYDPVLGQMLSPDNFVQNPSNSQNYNRYAYVLNNPLKYTDPDGEWVQIAIGAVIGGTVGYFSGRKAGLRGGDLITYTLAGATIGAISGGISAGVSSAAGTALTSTASSTIFSSGTGFAYGAATGFAGGAAGGFAGGALMTGLNNNTFGSNDNVFLGGLKGAAIGGGLGLVGGGIAGGIQAHKQGVNFWDGRVHMTMDDFASDGLMASLDGYGSLDGGDYPVDLSRNDANNQLIRAYRKAYAHNVRYEENITFGDLIDVNSIGDAYKPDGYYLSREFVIKGHGSMKLLLPPDPAHHSANFVGSPYPNTIIDKAGRQTHQITLPNKIIGSGVTRDGVSHMVFSNSAFRNTVWNLIRSVW